MKAKRSKQAASSRTEVKSGPHRVAHAITLLTDGARYGQVRDDLVRKFRVSRPTAERDIRSAYETIAAEVEREAPIRLARISTLLWRIAAEARAEGDYSASVSALGRLAKLLGLEAPKQLHHTVGGEEAEQAKAVMAALR